MGMGIPAGMGNSPSPLNTAPENNNSGSKSKNSTVLRTKSVRRFLHRPLFILNGTKIQNASKESQFRQLLMPIQNPLNHHLAHQLLRLKNQLQPNHHLLHQLLSQNQLSRHLLHQLLRLKNQLQLNHHLAHQLLRLKNQLQLNHHLLHQLLSQNQLSQHHRLHHLLRLKNQHNHHLLHHLLSQKHLLLFLVLLDRMQLLSLKILLNR